MNRDDLTALRKLADLVDQEIVPDSEFVNRLFAELVHSPTTSVPDACELLRATALPTLANRLKEIRTDDYVVIPFTIGDFRTPEERRRDAVELAPEYRRVCEAVEHWYGSRAAS